MPHEGFVQSVIYNADTSALKNRQLVDLVEQQAVFCHLCFFFFTGHSEGSIENYARDVGIPWNNYKRLTHLGFADNVTLHHRPTMRTLLQESTAKDGLRIGRDNTNV